MTTWIPLILIILQLDKVKIYLAELNLSLKTFYLHLHGRTWVKFRDIKGNLLFLVKAKRDTEESKFDLTQLDDRDKIN